MWEDVGRYRGDVGEAACRKTERYGRERKMLEGITPI
jgi:hypothetical protein